jgi:hypothetical protein
VPQGDDQIMHHDLSGYLAAAIALVGQITIVVGPIEHYEAVFDHDTNVLRIDPDVELLPALKSMLIDIVDGPAERELVGIAGGGGAATACGLVPAQADSEQRATPRLRLVPSRAV